MYNQEQMDELLQEGKSKVAQALADDPNVSAAKHAWDGATGYLEQQRHVLTNLTMDSRWTSWTPEQRRNARLAQGEKVMAAQDTVREKEELYTRAVDAYYHRQRELAIAAADSARRQEDEALWKAHALQQESEA